MIKATLVGSDGRAVNVTEFGQLVVSPVDYSTPVFREIDVINTAFNFVVPKDAQAIVITDIFLTTDRNAPVNGSRIEVYEADSATSTTEIEFILVEDIPRQAGGQATGINFFVPEGRWVNIKSDGASVLATIGYYYIPKR